MRWNLVEHRLRRTWSHVHTRCTFTEPGLPVPIVDIELLQFTHFEMQAITELKEDEPMLRRLCVTLALKQAYIKAIGQPLGFDFSRLEFNVKDKSAKGDGFPLIGWEFRIFRVNLGVARGEDLVQEYYECATAFFRNTPDTKFLWHSTQKELESWVQFINIDQMIKVTPKLTA